MYLHLGMLSSFRPMVKCSGVLALCLSVLCNWAVAAPNVTLLKYQVYGGTFNQYYGHLAAFGIATIFNIPNIEVPEHARVRKGTSMLAEFRDIPLSHLFNLNVTKEYYMKHFNINVKIRAPGEPSASGCHVRFQATCQTLNELMGRWEGLLSEAARACRPADEVVVDIGYNLWPVIWYQVPNIKKIVEGLPFNEVLVNMGNEIVQKLKQQVGEYDAVHLRVEKDSAYWYNTVGAKEFSPAVNWPWYYQAAKDLGMGNRNTLYLASSINTTRSQLATAFLRRFSNASYTKWNFLDKDAVKKTMGADALAVIDFHVIAHARKVIGYPLSSFSIFLKSYRHLVLGHPRENFAMADMHGMPWDLLGEAYKRHHTTCLDLVNFSKS